MSNLNNKCVVDVMMKGRTPEKCLFFNGFYKRPLTLCTSCHFLSQILPKAPQAPCDKGPAAEGLEDPTLTNKQMKQGNKTKTNQQIKTNSIIPKVHFNF